ncbi:hypothetical protein EXIGLDRAFT_716036 [Exidia glandulosa HHB12029]|uniref:Uncharacterized protein n=1 Tax=Exidia glandulosa HHB12029 TaxID=1314781 RepID=A0A165QSP1_EXIGL|nr:hypothetical protein EXIGLDRAFT_716036 [Exidia glandulosa HHB12029]
MQIGTFELSGDCEPKSYCARGSDATSTKGTCKLKVCRRDEFPAHYPQGGEFPPLCPEGFFCPDEADGCQAQFAAGSGCQLNRDDQCKPPDNAAELNDPGNNVNGSVCINFKCMFADATEGGDCEVENTPYIGYSDENEFAFVVSRGNCRKGLYCDAGTKKCLKEKAEGAACTADKECASNNCDIGNVCGVSPDEPAHFPMWVYIVVAVGIVAGILFTMIALYLVHRRGRDEEQEKRTQYWREQTAMRQNILQMKETARSGYHRHDDNPDQIASGESQIPMLPGRQGSNDDYGRGGPINSGRRPKR